MKTDERVQNVSHSFPVVGLLGVSFIVLKLCGVINWSWWWVTAPFWGGVALALTIVLGLLALAGLCWIGAVVLEKWHSR